MATSKDFLNYAIDVLSPTGNIAFKPMMGEYLFYYEGVHVGGLYDDRVLIKEVSENAVFNLKSVHPYDGAKRTMRLVEDFTDVERLREIFTVTAERLKTVANAKIESEKKKR